MSDRWAEDGDALPDYDPAALRLRARTRYFGLAIALASLLPYEIVAGVPQFVWDLAGELGPAALLGYLAPGLAGLTIVIAGFTLERPLTLSVVTLAALITATLCVQIGADAAAWDVLPLPDTLGRRPGVPILVMALTAAGAGMTFQAHSRLAGRIMLGASVGVALLFYLLPSRGEAPVDLVIGALSSWNDVPDWRFQLGFLIIAILVLWPALVALISLIHLKIPAGDDQPIVSIVARWGLPLLLAMFILRGVPGGAEGWSTFHGLGFVIFLAALVTVLSAAIEVCVTGFFAPDPERATERPRRRTLIIVGSIVGAVLVLQSVLALPPAKGVEWTLKPRTEAADHLFDETITHWNRARLTWERSATGATGREALLAVKNAARELVEEAEPIDSALATALERFTRETRTVGLAGRKWYRLIGEVNAAIRAAGLPYYLDPSVITFTRGDQKWRHFRMRTFGVSKVQRYDVDGDAYATLHVHRLGGGSSDSALLGFSRDLQRFAIVLLPELESFRDTLREGAAADPPTCQPDRDAEGTLFGAVSGGRAGQLCGQLLARVVGELGDAIDAQSAAVTDRHELQHQIDGPDMPLARIVRERFGRRSAEWRDRVNRELSGYLAQLAAPDASPHLGVVHLARLAVGESGQRVYPATAMLVLEALTGHRIVDAQGQSVDREEMANAIGALAGMSAEIIRTTAADAWAAQYGDRLPPISATTVSLPPQ